MFRKPGESLSVRNDVWAHVKLPYGTERYDTLASTRGCLLVCYRKNSEKIGHAPAVPPCIRMGVTEEDTLCSYIHSKHCFQKPFRSLRISLLFLRLRPSSFPAPLFPEKSVRCVAKALAIYQARVEANVRDPLQGA